MGFPLSVDGRVEVPLLEPDAVAPLLDSVQLALSIANASDIEREDARIRFRGEVTSMRFGWGVLGPFDQAEISASFGRPGAVKYRCSLRVLVLVVAAVAVVFGVIASRGSIVRGLLLMLVVWGVTVGGAYVVAEARLQRWIGSAVAPPPVEPLL